MLPRSGRARPTPAREPFRYCRLASARSTWMAARQSKPRTTARPRGWIGASCSGTTSLYAYLIRTPASFCASMCGHRVAGTGFPMPIDTGRNRRAARSTRRRHVDRPTGSRARTAGRPNRKASVRAHSRAMRDSYWGPARITMRRQRPQATLHAAATGHGRRAHRLAPRAQRATAWPAIFDGARQRTEP